MINDLFKYKEKWFIRVIFVKMIISNELFFKIYVKILI